MRLISTIHPAPLGFEYIAEQKVKPVDFLTGGAVAVLTHEAQTFFNWLDKRLASISGIFIEIGLEYRMSQIHETLWHVQVPLVMYDGLLVYVTPILHTITLTDEQWEARKLVEYQFERLKRDTEETNNDFEILTQRLRHQLDEQTKTTDLLDSKSAELQSANAKLLKAKQEAESANQAKSLFLATMSHEIRTPLNAVIGLTDIFDRSNLSDDQVKSLDTIRYSAATLMGVLSDILDFCKIESGKLDRVDKPFSLVDALNQIVSILENDAKQKGLLLTVYACADIPEMLVSDETRVRQIILNLCSNAIKFTDSEHKQGRVTVLASLVSEGAASKCFEISVKDNGIGISEENLKHLFKPFSQVDASTSRKYGGTGLGLSICHQLAQLLGGTIFCQSTVGEGTSFTLRIPYESADVPVESTLPQVPENTDDNFLVPEPMQGLRILIAEDNPINQMVIKKQIDKLGMRAAVVNNGVEAFEYYNNNPIDILLTDCHMPELDGYGLSAKIRETENSRSLPRLPIIAITADALVASESEAAACIDTFLIKPVALSALRAALISHAEEASKGINKAS